MNTKYIDFIDQTFEFPQEDFSLKGSNLLFHGIDLMHLIKQYGSPLKFIYLPKISENISKVKYWFLKAMKNNNYEAKYHYCYCTKSSHFKPVLQEALNNGIHIETSSVFDINIIKELKKQNKIKDTTYVLCNGFKQAKYIKSIARLINGGHENCIPILDNCEELDWFCKEIDYKFNVGIRIASEEEPKFEFYTSRLGIGYENIVPFYEAKIKNNTKAQLKMLHFFINTGIRDNAYYWNELLKCLRVYVAVKKICPSLDSLNIGGGFPIKNSLAFAFDFEYMIDEIVNQIKLACDEANVPVPHIFTEFGTFTVGESGGVIYEILHQKKQNDREKWNMIDSSFMTTLPDTWAISKRYVMLPINRWNDTYERVLLGGLTCDSDDYYNNEHHMNGIYLPKYNIDQPLYIGFFNTGAYQEAIGGYGGIQHCLIPHPKHILISKDAQGNISSRLFSDRQKAKELLKILGYGSD